jgi:TrpR-related protein YerC/YecD
MINKIAAPENPANYDRLCEAFLCLKNMKDCKAFLGDLCTPSEISAFIDRFKIAEILYADQNRSYRDLHQQTGVSVTTIGRVARFLHNGYGGYLGVLRALSTKIN